MASQPKPKVEKDNAERWLLTYADLMNLLLILFIILYAMSQISVAKFNELATSLRSAFGDSSPASVISQGGAGNSLIPLEAIAPSSVIPAKLEEQQMEAVKETVSQIVQHENLQGEVDVSIQERGVVISIKEKVLFRPGSAVIEDASKQTLESIGRVLLSIPGNYIRVEGHTDSDPISTPQFPSNWELSAARSTNVLRFLVDKAGINPRIISAVGYGEFTPRVPNDTPEHKAMNRRVDIVILKNMLSKSEAGTQAQPNNAAAGANAGNSEPEPPKPPKGKIEIRLSDYKGTDAQVNRAQADALKKIRDTVKANPDINMLVIRWNAATKDYVRQQAIVYNREKKTFDSYVKQEGEKQWTRYSYSGITDDIVNKANYIGQGFGEETPSRADDVDTGME